MTVINYANPKASYLAHKEEIDEAIARVLQSGQYSSGEEVEAFEEEFAAYIGVPYCVGVASGTSALEMACRLLPEPNIAIPSMTAVATPMAAKLAGKNVLFMSEFCDTICVHLYGQPVITWPFCIEDCAQACGAEKQGKKVGSFGEFGCFSFYPTKNLGALGDGGAIVVKDEWHYRHLMEMREYGWSEDRVESRFLGGNYRLDELQAAVLRVKLQHLDSDNEKRRTIAKHYSEAFKDLPIKLPEEVPNTKAVYSLYVVRVGDRDGVLERLWTKGVRCGVHYRIPCHRQAPFQPNNFSCPEADRASKEVLSLPIYPELSEDWQSAVIRAVKWAVRE